MLPDFLRICYSWNSDSKFSDIPNLNLDLRPATRQTCAKHRQPEAKGSKVYWKMWHDSKQGHNFFANDTQKEAAPVMWNLPAGTIKVVFIGYSRLFWEFREICDAHGIDLEVIRVCRVLDTQHLQNEKQSFRLLFLSNLVQFWSCKIKSRANADQGNNFRNI